VAVKRRRTRVLCLAVLPAAVLSLGMSCGPSTKLVQFGDDAVRAGQRARGAVGSVPQTKTGIRSGLSAVAERWATPENRETVASAAADAVCSAFETMLREERFPTQAEWLEAVSTALTNAALDIQEDDLGKFTEAVMGVAFEALREGDLEITVEDVEEASESLC
jgi:hypothetical protein